MDIKMESVSKEELKDLLWKDLQWKLMEKEDIVYNKKKEIWMKKSCKRKGHFRNWRAEALGRLDIYKVDKLHLLFRE